MARPRQLAEALAHVGRPLYLIHNGEALAWSDAGCISFGTDRGGEGFPLRAAAHPCAPENLGSAGFRRDHGLRFAYVAGAMAGGIGSPELVEVMGRAGMLGFYGAAGLAPDVVEEAIYRISTRLGDTPWGANLIHSPYEPRLEEEVADLYARRGVHLVSASAYLDLTLPLVRYRVRGIHVDAAGQVRTPNRVMAKVSRIEVARKFFSPPPPDLLAELVRAGDISSEQARLAETIPVAQDLTVEADSGGHTDNRPALAVLPTMLALRDRMQSERSYDAALRVGVAGGVATPHAVAASFAMGADYVLTGSINQACLEAGTSDTVRRMLAEAEQADVAMAPAADMFEMGVKLQVLKRGTLFAMRAQKLHDLYLRWGSLEEIPAAERASLERTVFRATFEEIWAETRAFWGTRDPEQAERAQRDAKHRMALVFRWYLGMSSRWANCGEVGRELDYQIWCGPSMGAFNEWTRGSFLERPEARRAVIVARNLLHGAAILSRANALREQGAELAADCVDVRPRVLDEIEELCA
ncbi:MAG: PfaD family polyunsaturated fatty acid/polyketide biosynthesis protein [Nannocystaceae bacterium]